MTILELAKEKFPSKKEFLEKNSITGFEDINDHAEGFNQALDTVASIETGYEVLDVEKIAKELIKLYRVALYNYKKDPQFAIDMEDMEIKTTLRQICNRFVVKKGKK